MKKKLNKLYLYVLPDKIYLKKIYKKRLNQKLNLREPVYYSEKLNWLKLYDRQPEYTMMVDKYRVRDYVSEMIGEEYLIPLLKAWDKVEDIDFSELPNEFVIKCNHSNGVIICKDKKDCDWEKIKKELQKQFDKNLYKAGREWAYKHVSKKIICEQYMKNQEDFELKDYKFYCFDGKPKVVCVICGRTTQMTMDYYDMDFQHLDIRDKFSKSDERIQKPIGFEQMIKVAEKLSEGIPHVRVDLYNINQQIYFGEMTFYDDAGFGCLKPDEWNKQFGEWIKLPSKNRGILNFLKRRRAICIKNKKKSGI